MMSKLMKPLATKNALTNEVNWLKSLNLESKTRKVTKKFVITLGTTTVWYWSQVGRPSQLFPSNS